MITRIRRAWQALAPRQRLAAGCALALFGTMFLPWYSHSGFSRGRPVSDTLRAFEAFSFVEAAVLLVAGSVLVLLFARAEGRRFHLPGGDGTVIMAAGAWAALLTFIRTLDKPDAGEGTIVGVEWGIFVAILASLALAYAGYQLRQAHLAEPGEADARRAGGSAIPRDPRPRPAAPADDAPTQRAPARREPRPARKMSAPPAPHAAPTDVAAPPRRPRVEGGEQLSFDEQE